MNIVIANLFEMIKKSDDMITMEEQVQGCMHEVFAEMMGTVMTVLDLAIKKEKQEKGWKVVRGGT